MVEAQSSGITCVVSYIDYKKCVCVVHSQHSEKTKSNTIPRYEQVPGRAAKHLQPLLLRREYNRYFLELARFILLFNCIGPIKVS